MKNFSDYNFKPSDVIAALNRFYEFTKRHKDYPYTAFTLYTSDPSKTVWTFSKSRVPDAIAYLREECDIFYTPGLDWADLKYKLTSKACEKEYGTADIREMFPRCLVSPRGCGKSRAQFEVWRRELDLHPIKDLPLTTNEKEALEALQDIYMELDCPGEAAFRRLHNLDIDDVSIEHMKDYIKDKAKFYKDLSERTGEECQTLRNLINQIHEDSDI